MPTADNLTIIREDCILLMVSQSDPLEDQLAAARGIAIQEAKPVIFALPSVSRMFYVTYKSDIERMMLRFNDRYNCRMIIE